jgi:hypothetical protein
VSDAAATPAAEVSVANHPRAVASIRRARARVALAAFVLVLLLCLHAGVSGQAATLRALVAGVAGFVGAWMIALALWRQIVLAELRQAQEKRAARRRAATEQ